MCTKCFRQGKHLLLALFAVLFIMTLSGCGKSDSSPDAGTNAPAEVTVDNKPLYGAYSINLTVGSCPAQLSSVIIGNDPSRAGDDTYIYLPENQSTYTFSGLTVTRTGNKVTVTGTQDTETKSIEVGFNSDFTAGTVSGTISDTKLDNCSGKVTGDIALITRTPVEINSKYLQYRSFSNSSNNVQAAWAGLTKNSQPAVVSDIKDMTLYKDKIDPSNKVGTGKAPDQFGQGTTYTGSYDKGAGAVNIGSNPSQWSGLSLNLLPHQPAGDYILTATVPETETSKSYTVTSHFHYPGDVSAPVISGLNAAWNGTGLVLSWTNPSNPNADYTDLIVSIIKTDNGATGKVLMSVSVNKTDGINTITIPTDKMELVKTLANTSPEFGVLAVQIQSRKISDQGMNYASGFSDMVILPNTDTWKNLDNSIFYGAYSVTRTTGSCSSEKKSLIIGNDPAKAGNNDYLYLPGHALTGSSMNVIVTRKNKSVITVLKTNGTMTENLAISFSSQDLTTATISGTVTNPGGACEGNVTGTLSLITRTPVSISARHMASVAPYSGIGTKFELLAALEKNGLPVLQTDISGITLKNSTGSTILSSVDMPSLFQRREFLSGVINSGTVSLTSQTPTVASLLFTNYFGTLPAGDYTVCVSANDVENYTISSLVHIPDVSLSPVIASSDLIANYNSDGSMTIGWTIPSQPTDELVISIIKTDMGMTWKKYLLTIHVNPATNTVSAVIPKVIADRIITMGTSMEDGVYVLEVQARKYTDNITVGSIGYSAKLVKNSPN